MEKSAIQESDVTLHNAGYPNAIVQQPGIQMMPTPGAPMNKSYERVPVENPDQIPAQMQPNMTIRENHNYSVIQQQPTKQNAGEKDPPPSYPEELMRQPAYNYPQPATQMVPPGLYPQPGMQMTSQQEPNMQMLAQTALAMQLMGQQGHGSQMGSGPDMQSLAQTALVMQMMSQPGSGSQMMGQPGMPMMAQPGMPIMAQPGMPMMAQPGMQMMAQPGPGMQMMGPNGAPIMTPPGPVMQAAPTVWIPAPERPPGCPPGLEYLCNIDSLFVHQEIEMLELLSGIEQNNKYSVTNGAGQKVYAALEDTPFFSRNFGGSARAFDIKIMDNFMSEVIHLRRDFACSCCCFPCCLQKLYVYSPPGVLIGTVEQCWSFCRPSFKVKNEAGNTVLRIKGPFCVCECGEIIFKVLAEKEDITVGNICKQWAGYVQEMATNADNFNITFPIDLDVKVKALLLGALFLIDFMYFEDRPQNRNDRRS